MTIQRSGIPKWNELQLRFDLDLDDALEEERAITPEQARQISEAARMAFEALSKDADREDPFGNGEKNWFGDYLRLRQQGWPWRVACYMAWASSPKRRRWPKTLEKLCTEVLGLTGPRQIFKWRRKYPSIDTVVAMMQAASLWEHRRDVFDVLTKMAMDDDYKAHNDRKMYLEMTGDYVPRSQMQVGLTAKDLSELSDAELDAMMGEEEAESKNAIAMTEEKDD
jgi:hypothetical protein